VSNLLGNARIEDVSLRDLERICKEAEKFKMELILMGGYAVRAYTKERSWRFTKDIDFITRKRDLTALRAMHMQTGP
jgi:predicted nucleotidyltransferase component of viral defense system